MNHYSQFNFEDRKKLQELLLEGEKITEIAKVLGKSRSGVYKELERNTDNGEYNAVAAQEKSMKRAENKGNSLKIEGNKDILNYISHKILVENKSVKEISEALFEDTENPYLSVKTIYNYIDKGIIPGVSRDSLKNNTTKMFSDGLIRIPNKTKSENNFNDGDLFEILIANNNTIILKKKME